MKTVFNVLLVALIVVLGYICYDSITGPIKFDEIRKEREKSIIARLIDIRKAQKEFSIVNNREYTKDFDELIAFVRNGKLPIVVKIGQLTDKQLEDGLTEKKAVAIIEKAKKTNRYDEVKRWGLEEFKRDTMWVSVLDSMYPRGFNPDSLRFIPYGNGSQFEMDVKNDTAKSGAPIHLFVVKAHYDTYLSDLNKQELINLKDKNSKLDLYNGLMIGSIDKPNNGEGNWE